jgi:dihydroorotase
MTDARSHSLLLKNGTTFDSVRRTFRKANVLVSCGKIARIGEALDPGGGGETLDLSGRLITPGLVDFHLHCFRYGQVLSIDADELSPRSGTTAFVDAGSSGSLNFPAFREYVILPSAARILAFLNISAVGMQMVGAAGIGIGENDDERLLDIASAAEIIEKHRDHIVGVKVRMYTGLPSLAALTRGRQLADLTRLPLMVHIASGAPLFRDILPWLRVGDIVTHIYHGGDDSLLDSGGVVRDEFREARSRGIEFDVGLDRVHTDFLVARSALDQGFDPDYLSTDLTVSNRHVTVDMPTTISKFVALGMPLEDALAKSTWAPAAKLGRQGEFGVLQEGLDADLAVFETQEGRFRFSDSYGHSIEASARLTPRLTIRRGVALAPLGRETARYDFIMK